MMLFRVFLRCLLVAAKLRRLCILPQGFPRVRVLGLKMLLQQNLFAERTRLAPPEPFQILHPSDAR
jgi:hypothetical protein